MFDREYLLSLVQSAIDSRDAEQIEKAIFIIAQYIPADRVEAICIKALANT